MTSTFTGSLSVCYGVGWSPAACTPAASGVCPAHPSAICTRCRFRRKALGGLGSATAAVVESTAETLRSWLHDVPKTSAAMTVAVAPKGLTFQELLSRLPSASKASSSFSSSSSSNSSTAALSSSLTSLETASSSSSTATAAATAATSSFSFLPGFSQEQKSLLLSATAVQILSGLAAGLAVDVPLHPLDTVKTRLQSPQGFVKAGGMRGLYSGFSPVLLRSLPCSTLFFSTYSQLQWRIGQSAPWLTPSVRDAASGMAANLAACSLRMPCEVLKQQLQAPSYDGADRSKKPTLLSIAARVSSSRGLRGFYAGFGATALREVTFAAMQMPSFEALKRRHPLAKAGANGGEVTGSQRAIIGVTAGGVAGAVAGFATTPLDVAKTRAMLAGSDGPGLLTTLVQLVKAEGASALLRGAMARTTLVGLGCGLSLGTFEGTKAVLLPLSS